MCGCRLRRTAWIAAVAASGYAALAGLVAAGSLTGLDQWAVLHAMPGSQGVGSPPTTLEAIVPLLHSDFGTPLLAAAQLLTLPAQAVVSGVVVVGVCALLARRGRIDAAAAWTAAWLLATAIEVLCKGMLVRPALYRHGLHVVGFDSSWPSGHTVRAAIVAATLATAWPRLRAAFAAWVAVVAVLLETAGFHTPSDILGGLVLAALLAAGAVAAERSGALRRGAAAARAARSAARPTSRGR